MAIVPARWQALRRYTDARIALGRAGHSQPTAAHLAFQLAHAQARDAVQQALDLDATIAAIEGAGMEAIGLHSAAADRATYLRRPDLGRRLDARSRARLARRAARTDATTPDLALVVADGLSAPAIERSAVALLSALRARLQADAGARWALAPVAVVELGRVAVGDPIGELLGARAVAVLIGERPGLSAPDSLGVYLTWAPRIGRSDAERNCISNIRPAGLAVDAAAAKLHQLLNQARALQLTGVALKDEAEPGPALGGD